ncbi:succinate dehydrogenase assembly factor 4 [Azospirillum formosense]|uniref:DUF1674 domain-containing protein n=1 Tax=Azospirillum formosense TaxID=861533 RepID=UPI00338EC11A
MTETKTTGPAPQDAAKPDAETTAETTAGTGAKGPEQMPGEIGGPQGPEPTRFGDWEFKGRCSDF